MAHDAKYDSPKVWHFARTTPDNIISEPNLFFYESCFEEIELASYYCFYNFDNYYFDECHCDAQYFEMSYFFIALNDRA